MGSDGFLIPQRYWAWLGTRRAVAILLWLVTLATAAHHFHRARTWFATKPATPDHLRRADGNEGHTYIDFGGQWVMGRMLVLGHGRELYHRDRQWEVVRAGYPVEWEAPIQNDPDAQERHRPPFGMRPDPLLTMHDADRMMHWFMGADPAEGDGIGGPLYPPVHAFVYAPIGLFEHPKDAYPVFQFVATLFAFAAGLGICKLTGGRVWWSVGTLAVLLFPGCRGALDLGQNPTITLTIAVWGWVLAARGRDVAGGVVWGLFAFKPVWGLAFFLVPLLSGRWRFCLAMVGTGAALGLLTLPVVGLQTWFDWLQVGREAAALYNVNDNWVHFSRDLQGIPRRFLLDFQAPEAARDTPLARAAAWGLWGFVFATTVVVYLLRYDRRPTGLAAAFLLLGAFLTCYRFMYYDLLLALVGVAALFAEPGRLFRTRVFDLTPGPVALLEPGTPVSPPTQPGARLTGYVSSFPLTVLIGLFLIDNWLVQWAIEATVGVGGAWHRPPGGDVPKAAFAFDVRYPWDAVLVALLWAWCGVRLVVEKRVQSIT
ncbi:MAG: DUF2029 domain-containing protein [Gemmataceae bacterium]|nr:DUF2029 domain-containing protein [Gemmataceae bacterium]